MEIEKERRESEQVSTTAKECKKKNKAVEKKNKEQSGRERDRGRGKINTLP